MNKKKLIIIISSAVGGLVLIGALVIGLLSLFKSEGKSSGEPIISVGSVSAAAGKNIRVPVSFKANPGAMGFLLEFEYDTEALEFISAENGELLTDCETAENSGSIRLVSVENEDVTRDGVLAYLNFKIKEGASGKNEIKLICDENSVCNYDEETVAVKTENGTVTVE